MEGRTRLILSAGLQSCSQAGGAGTSLEARRAPPCHLLGGPPGSLGTRGWTHGHRGLRMEEAMADSLGDLSCSRASVHQPWNERARSAVGSGPSTGSLAPVSKGFSQRKVPRIQAHKAAWLHLVPVPFLRPARSLIKSALPEMPQARSCQVGTPG